MIITFKNFLNEKKDFVFEHDIEKEFEYLNNLLFNGELILPPYSFLTGKNRVAEIRFKPFLEFRFNKTIIFTIEQFRNILAHEMVHLLEHHRKIIDRSGVHGNFFNREMNRINNMNVGIYINPKDETILPTQMRNKTVKDVFFILYHLRNEYVLCPFSTKEICEYWWDKAKKSLSLYKNVEIWMGENQMSEMNRFFISRKNIKEQAIKNEFFNEIMSKSKIYKKEILNP